MFSGAISTCDRSNMLQVTDEESVRRRKAEPVQDQDRRPRAPALAVCASLAIGLDGSLAVLQVHDVGSSSLKPAHLQS